MKRTADASPPASKRVRCVASSCHANAADVANPNASPIGPVDDRAAAHITRLSDELLLRIVNFLSIGDLFALQRVSKRCSRIAVDGHVWRALFYNRFVRPRASRIPGLAPSTLHYSPRSSRWLDDEGLSRDRATNWKGLYKLRYKWNMGSCAMHEIPISESDAPPPSPPVLVKLHEGVVLVVDASSGMRAWRLRTSELIASTALDQAAGITPTALAIDDESGGEAAINVAVGFEHGGFAIYQLDMRRSIFSTCYTTAEATAGHSALVAMAFLGGFLATISQSQSFVVYTLESADNDGGPATGRMMYAPKILASLHSHTVWPPLSLSLRRSVNGTVLACIVYAFPLYSLGWSVGIQELRLTYEGVSHSRIATAVAAGFTNSALGSSILKSRSGPGSPSRSCISRPTCISYSHPYLLTSHADNTLTLYLIKSTDTLLSIDAGQRLWGHTSAISTAHVAARGKAVSVSFRGTEIRIWDLEGGVSERRRVNASVQVESRSHEPGDVDQCRPQSVHWLGGFDKEKLVVLRDKGDTKRTLMVYDFTR